MGVSPLKGPWLPSLPEGVFLDQLIKKDKVWNGHSWEKALVRINPIIGLVDNPANQVQEPLKINLGREGLLAILI